jgi:hypothetical protein
MRSYLLTVAIILFALVPPSAAQTPACSNLSAVDFVLHPDKPLVYLEFVRVGTRHRANEPSTGLWLRLFNNSRLPIDLRTSDGGENLVVSHKVVYDHHYGPWPIEDGEQTPRQQTPQSKMPQGYWYETASRDKLAPGESVEFSVPTNHVSEDWHVEVPFWFEFSNTSGVTMNATFYLYQVPKQYQNVFKLQ